MDGTNQDLELPLFDGSDLLVVKAKVDELEAVSSVGSELFVKAGGGALG